MATNVLLKTINSSFEPGNPGTPAFPGQQALPARSVVEYHRVCQAYTNTPPGIPTVRTDPVTGKPVLVYVQAGGGYINGVRITTTYKCADKKVYVTYPAQPYLPPTPAIPYSPAAWRYDMNLGWNSGGRSASSFSHNGRYEFSVGGGVAGVVTGFNTLDTGYGFREISHAWQFSGRIARIYERGLEVAYYGAYAENQVFGIRREGNIVKYYVDGTDVYTSTSRSYGAVFADASMYSGGDFIFTPFVAELSGGAGNVSFMPLACYGTDEADYASGVVSFEPMECESNPAPQGAVSFEPLDCTSLAAGHGEASLSFEPMESEGESIEVITPPYALANLHFEQMQLGAYGRPGVGANIEMKAMSCFGVSGYGDVYGEGAMEMEPMIAWGSAYETNNAAAVFPLIVMATPTTGAANIFVVMDSSLTVSTSLTIVLAYLGELFSEIEMSGTMTTLEMHQALMRSIVQMGFSVPVYDQAAEAWAVNEETNGSTRYEQYDFNSFAKIGDSYYGAKRDGIYALDGATDDGEAIRSSIQLGKRDFFTPKLKRLSNAYIGMSGTGRLFVKVIAEGQTYIYATRDSSTDLQVQRADLGKGLRANYFDLEIYNEDGGDFEISQIEFVAATIQRRI